MQLWFHMVLVMISLVQYLCELLGTGYGPQSAAKFSPSSETRSLHRLKENAHRPPGSLNDGLTRAAGESARLGCFQRGGKFFQAVQAFFDVGHAGRVTD